MPTMSQSDIRAAIQVAKEKLEKAQAKGNERRVSCFQQELQVLQAMLEPPVSKQSLPKS